MSIRRIGKVVAVAVGLSAAPVSLEGQALQAISAQFSVLGAQPFGGGFANVGFGPGFEFLVRWTRLSDLFSVGAGIERTSHAHASGESLALFGGFVEPRWVISIGQETRALYIAGRLAMARVSFPDADPGTGFTMNGGGGMIFLLTDRVNLDAGATVGFRKLGVLNRPDPLVDVDMGSGANVVARVGISVGIR